MSDSLTSWLGSWLAERAIFTPDTLAIYWQGIQTTLSLVALSLLLGFVISLPLSLARGSRHAWVRRPIQAYTYVFRGTPLLVQLYLIYYGVVFIEDVQESWLWPLVKEPFLPALLAFTLNTVAYTTEIFHGAITNTPRGEMEAARACGMSKPLIYRRIVFPSAFRRALPAYGNEVILTLHASAIASTVTLMDITGAAQFIYARYYAPFDAFIFAALLYLAITLSLLYALRRLESRFNPQLRGVRRQRRKVMFFGNAIPQKP
ncbi:MAG: amino acid ABC transporter permease [Halomonas sp.]|nr:amino acid ABC transporter permease [Halomonas sp.]|tara:strand:+ start:1426 stop:2208 length:783 start_codon:yes stop_codon:yes gene_type:complete